MTRLGLLAVLLAVLWGAAPAEAHGTNASYTEITITPSQLEVVYLLGVDEIVTHFPVGIDRSDRVSVQEIDRTAPAVFSFLAEHVSLAVDGRAVALERGSYRPHANGTFIRFELTVALEGHPAGLALAVDHGFFERFGPRHINFVTVRVEGQVQQAALTMDRPRAVFSTGYHPLLMQCARFTWLGIQHIFLGYDHIVFLFALIIIGGRLGHVVGIVSAFTVAHSLTLALAALQIVTLPSRLIEGGIALTIAYVAFDNFFASATPHRWVLTFCFGLVHGFGFASVLREVSVPRSQLIPTLVSFNVGVEIGQILIIAVLFPVTIWLARQRFRRPVVLAASGGIFLIGIAWFIQRAFDLSFMPV